MPSDQPFNKTLARIMDDQEISNRELARRTHRKYKWGTHWTINQLRLGSLQPTSRTIEMIAACLQVPPTTFAEYRLMVARERLDPAVVGLKAALQRLEEIDS